MKNRTIILADDLRDFVWYSNSGNVFGTWIVINFIPREPENCRVLRKNDNVLSIAQNTKYLLPGRNYVHGLQTRSIIIITLLIRWKRSNKIIIISVCRLNIRRPRTRIPELYHDSAPCAKFVDVRLHISCQLKDVQNFLIKQYTFFIFVSTLYLCSLGIK